MDGGKHGSRNLFVKCQLRTSDGNQHLRMSRRLFIYERGLRCVVGYSICGYTELGLAVGDGPFYASWSVSSLAHTSAICASSTNKPYISSKLSRSVERQ